jgi:hypothetical protein
MYRSRVLELLHFLNTTQRGLVIAAGKDLKAFQLIRNAYEQNKRHNSTRLSRLATVSLEFNLRLSAPIRTV